MSTKLNRTLDVLSKLKDEGKIIPMNSPEDIANIGAITERMKSVRRDYQIKNRNSQMRAAQVILTA